MSLFDSNLLSLANTPAAPVAPLHTGLGDDAWLAASQALAAAEAAHPAGMLRPFLPWQAAAYNYCKASIARWGGTLLGDDMGMGKTQVILALVNDALAEARTAGNPHPYAIVVSPTVAEHGYRGDLHAAFPGLTLHTVRGRKVDYAALPQADIYFISDDPLTLKAWLVTETNPAKGKYVTVATPWATGAAIVVRDEIHRDKGNVGKPTTRSRVMLAVGHACRAAGKAIVGATGTLLTNRVVESFVPLQIVGGERLIMALTPGANKLSGFLWRYCAPQQVTTRGGGTAIDFRGQDDEAALLLHEYLRRTVYVRREKSDLPSYCANQHANANDATECSECGEPVVPSLPDSGYHIAPIALTSEVLVRYNRIARDLYNLIVEEKGAAAAMRSERFLVVRGMMMMWEEAGRASAAAAVDYVQRLTAKGADNEGEQVVMFFHHSSVRDALITALIKSGITYTLIDGTVTDKPGDPARQQAIAEFQRGDAQVCLAQHGAAGMSVTLTAAKHSVYVELPWSAGTLAQCSGRNLRVDDTTRERAANGESITWHVVEGCHPDGEPLFTANMWDVLCRKAHIVDAVNAGRPVTISEENVQLAVLENWMPSASRYGGW